MVNFVRFCAIYNASAVVVFLTPGFLEALGVKLPHSLFWVWLPALMGLFAGIVLWHSSRNLHRYGTFPYYNGIIRLIFVIASIYYSFGETAGTYIGYLAAGDLPLAIGCIFGIPHVTGRSHLDLLTNGQETGA